MDDLVKMVSEKTGLSADLSKMAVETVVGYLKKQLPEPLAAQIDGYLKGGEGGTGDIASSVIKGLGGILGGK